MKEVSSFNLTQKFLQKKKQTENNDTNSYGVGKGSQFSKYK